MNEKPEALRVADRLDLWGDQGDLLEAAAELRRWHAEREALRSELATLRAQNYETQSLLAGAEAEVARLTTLRPASERLRGIALWHFASGAATVSQKVQIGSIGWTPLPKVKAAK